MWRKRDSARAQSGRSVNTWAPPPSSQNHRNPYCGVRPRGATRNDGDGRRGEDAPLRELGNSAVPRLLALRVLTSPTRDASGPHDSRRRNR